MKLRKLTLTALFAALCAVGGFIKIPSGVGSLALDTVPALLAASFLPPVLVGAASMTGHLASAMYAGFPLGPFHILIAIEIMIILYGFASLDKAGHHSSKWVFFVVANGLIAPLPFYFLVSPAFFAGAVPAILLATVMNAIVAAVAMPVLVKAAGGRFGLVR